MSLEINHQSRFVCNCVIAVCAVGLRICKVHFSDTSGTDSFIKYRLPRFEDHAGKALRDTLTTMATGVSVNPAPLSSTMYPGPPPPYAYPSNPVSSIPPPPSHTLSPAPRRSMELDKDPSQSQPPRQSLPSIHEALGNENPLPYPGHPSSGAPAHSAHHHPPPPPNVLSRPSAEGPTGPPNPFSNNTAPSFLRDSQYHPQQHSPAPADLSRSSLVSLSTQDSRKQSLQSVSGKSPTTSTQTAPTSISTSQYDYSAPTSVIASPNTFGNSQQYSWPSQPPASQPGSYDSRSYNGNAWKASVDQMRVDEKRELIRPAGVPMGQPHSDSVKRQLDSYDVESSLAEVGPLVDRQQ